MSNVLFLVVDLLLLAGVVWLVGRREGTYRPGRLLSMVLVLSVVAMLIDVLLRPVMGYACILVWAGLAILALTRFWPMDVKRALLAVGLFLVVRFALIAGVFLLLTPKI